MPPSQPKPPDGSAPFSATHLGAYRIEKLLGEGSTGAVYRAVDERSGRTAALKVLSSRLSRDEQQVQRFFDEARITRIVPHPGLVEVFDAGTLADGTSYLAMEYLPGESLRARAARSSGRLPLNDALWITRQVAAALSAVHGKGILHRDLSPDNVMLLDEPADGGGGQTDPGRVKLLDFGMAKFLDSATRRTAAGTVMGTPTYMSPEQCLAQGALSDRSDVYSLGVMLFEMLAGQPPFGGAGQAPLATIMQHVQGTPPLLRQRLPSAPAPVEALVGEMLSRAPERRPAMAQVVERIRLLEAGDPDVSPSAATPQAPRAPSPPGHAPASADELAQAVGRLPTLAAPTVQRDPPLSSAGVGPDQAEALLPTLSVPAVSAAVSPPPDLPDTRSPAARRRLVVAIFLGLLLGGGAVAVALFLHLF